MAAPSDSGRRLRAEDSSSRRLVKASSPDPVAGKDVSKEHSAEDNASRSLMERFIQNLMHALSDWPT